MSSTNTETSENNDIRFHGTVLPYVETVTRESGAYRHLSGAHVYLSKDRKEAERYAIRRGKQFGVEGCVLAVSVEQLTGMLIEDSERQSHVPFLPPKTYVVLGREEAQ